MPIALVTGVTSGIGLEVAVQLLRLGLEVVGTARSEARGRRALEEIRRRSGSPSISLLACDFEVQAEIRKLAQDFRRAHGRLDVLINNAGAANIERRITPDGIEATFAVNHLAPFLLTQLLLDLLRESAPARIVNVASAIHYDADMDFDDLQFARGGYGLMRAYGRSKLANVLFTRALAERLAGSGVTVNAVHPGVVATNIWSGGKWYGRPLVWLARRRMKSAEEGAARAVFLATRPEVQGETGGYYSEDRKVEPSAIARSAAVASRLWIESEKLVENSARDRAVTSSRSSAEGRTPQRPPAS